MLQLDVAPLYHFPHLSDLRVTKTGRVLFQVPDPDALSEVQFPLTDVINLRLTEANEIVLDTTYANYTLTVPHTVARPLYDVLRKTWHYYLGLYDHNEPNLSVPLDIASDDDDVILPPYVEPDPEPEPQSAPKPEPEPEAQPESEPEPVVTEPAPPPEPVYVRPPEPVFDYLIPVDIRVRPWE